MDEFRAHKAISSKGVDRLWEIFCKVCPPLKSRHTSQFGFWVNELFSLHDLDFPDWMDTTARDEKCTPGMVYMRRWTQCQPWWKVIGPLNAVTPDLHRMKTDYCSGRIMFISSEGDVIFLEERELRDTVPKAERQIFLVHHKISTMVKVLQEDQWNWGQGYLDLCYDVLASAAPALWGQEKKVIYIPKDDILRGRGQTAAVAAPRRLRNT